MLFHGGLGELAGQALDIGVRQEVGGVKGFKPSSVLSFMMKLGNYPLPQRLFRARLPGRHPMGTASDLLDQSSKFIAGLEEWNSFGGHFDPSAGFRIPSDAGPPRPSPETAETADLDFVAALDGAHHGVEDEFHYHPGFLSRNLHHARNFLNQICFRQNRRPASPCMSMPDATRRHGGGQSPSLLFPQSALLRARRGRAFSKRATQAHGVA
jgi:hypothetical protein